MREIKFRVWTGSTMEYNVIAGKFGAFYVNPGAKGDGLDDKDTDCLTPFNTKYFEQMPLMQFTGLKGKNGKEIYEGDIVNEFRKSRSFSEGRSIKRVIEWKDYMTLDDSYGETAVGFNLFGGELEVIGNIYENPDLLRSCTTN